MNPGLPGLGGLEIGALLFLQILYLFVILWLVWQFLQTFKDIARTLEDISETFRYRGRPNEPPGE